MLLLYFIMKKVSKKCSHYVYVGRMAKLQCVVQIGIQFRKLHPAFPKIL